MLAPLGFRRESASETVEKTEGSRTQESVRVERVELDEDYFGFWYQKIARATRKMVIIQSTISLARFFSLGSAINEVQHT